MPIRFVMSVSLSVCISAAPTGRSFMKFRIVDPNNVANINVSHYTIDKMRTGAELVNKIGNYLKA